MLPAGDGSNGGEGLGAFDQRLQGWAIPHEDIEICRHADGTEWLLVREEVQHSYNLKHFDTLTSCGPKENHRDAATPTAQSDCWF